MGYVFRSSDRRIDERGDCVLSSLEYASVHDSSITGLWCGDRRQSRVSVGARPLFASGYSLPAAATGRARRSGPLAATASGTPDRCPWRHPGTTPHGSALAAAAL